MNTNISFEQWESEQMQNPEFRAAVEASESEHQESRTRIAQAIMSPGPKPHPLDRIGLDGGIEEAVKILFDNGVETCESCEGDWNYNFAATSHPFPEPTIRFHGQHEEGYRAFAIAMTYGLRVSELRRVWTVNQNGELVGPLWEIVFFKKDGND